MTTPFLELVTTEFTGLRSIPRQHSAIQREVARNLDVAFKYVECNNFRYQYSVSVRWEYTGFCKRDHLPEVRGVALEMLNKAIYDELDVCVLRMRHALHDEDMEAMATALSQMERLITA